MVERVGELGVLSFNYPLFSLPIVFLLRMLNTWRLRPQDLFCQYQALPLVSHPTSLPFKQAQALPPPGWAAECWAWCLDFGVKPKCAFQLLPLTSSVTFIKVLTLLSCPLLRTKLITGLTSQHAVRITRVAKHKTQCQLHGGHLVDISLHHSWPPCAPVSHTLVQDADGHFPGPSTVSPREALLCLWGDMA